MNDVFEETFLPPRRVPADLVDQIRVVVGEHRHVARVYAVVRRSRVILEGRERVRDQGGVFVELGGRARGRHLDAVRGDLGPALVSRHCSLSLGNHPPPPELREVAVVVYERGATA